MLLNSHPFELLMYGLSGRCVQGLIVSDLICKSSYLVMMCLVTDVLGDGVFVIIHGDANGKRRDIHFVIRIFA